MGAARRRGGLLLAALGAALVSVACGAAIPSFFVQQGDQSYLLSRGDSSGSLNAASVGFLKGAVGATDTETLRYMASLGVNCIRTYTTDNATQVLRDAASFGMSVILGIQLPPISMATLPLYTTTAGQNTLLDQIRQQVLLYANDPNLLGWIVGNEANVPPYQAFTPYWTLINRATTAIDAIDTAHVVGTAIAYPTNDTLTAMNIYAKNLDFLAVNVFGPQGANVHAVLQQGNINMPYMISEFGPAKWYQAPQTTWGDVYEDTPQTKAQYLVAAYTAAVNASSTYLCTSANSGNNCQGALILGRADSPVPGQGAIRPSGAFGGACFGAFAHQFGLQSATSSTFNSMFASFPRLPAQAMVSPMPNISGRYEQTEQADAVFFMYQGGYWPRRRAPSIGVTGVTINGLTQDMNVLVQIGRISNASVPAVGFNGGALQYRWVVMSVPPSPSEIPANSQAVPFTRVAQNNTGGSITWMPPSTPGFYRLQVWVSDGGGKVSVASIPFYAVYYSAPQALYDAADAYVLDGNNSGVATGSSSVIVSTTQPIPGNNSYPFIRFGAPDWPYNVTPAKVTLNVFLLGGQAIPTGLRGVNAYLIPPDAPKWDEATLTYRTSPCTPSATTPMPGLCTTLAGRMTAIVPTSPATIWTAPGPEQPQGLQAVGNYFQWDVTGAVAALVAQGAPVSFALVNDMASAAVNNGLRWASRETIGMLRAPFLSLEWPNQTVTQSLYMTDTGDAKQHLQALATAVGTQLGGSGVTTAAVLGHAVSASVTLSGATEAAWDAAAAAALAAGLALDIQVDPANVRVGPALPLLQSRRRRGLLAVQTPGVEVTFVVSGHPGGGANQQAGQAQANRTADAINTLLLGGNSNAATLLRAAGFQFGFMAQGQPPVVWRQVTVFTPLTPYGAQSDNSALLSFISTGALKRELAKLSVLVDVAPLDGVPRVSPDVAALLAQVSAFSRGTAASGLASAIAPLVTAWGLVVQSPPPSGGSGAVPVPVPVPVPTPSGGGGGFGGGGNASSSSDITLTVQGASSASVTASVNAVIVVAIAAIFVSGVAFFVASGALMQAAGTPHSDGARLQRVEAVLLGKVAPGAGMGAGGGGGGYGGAPYREHSGSPAFSDQGGGSGYNNGGHRRMGPPGGYRKDGSDQGSQY